jgi:hypothetical protein
MVLAGHYDFHDRGQSKAHQGAHSCGLVGLVIRSQGGRLLAASGF